MRGAPETPTLGVEAEFLGWDDLDTNINELVLKGYSFESYYDEHSYHCSCEFCDSIGNGGIIVPVAWKRQHDSSLTVEGGEWISSPFPALKPFVEQVLEAIEILSEGDWTPAYQGTHDNRRGDGFAEAGIHIHCSIMPSRRPGRDIRATNEFVRLMRGYAPELYLLTAPTGMYRSTTYRSLTNIEGDGHRNFLNVKAPGRVEWRMFEPGYDVPGYMESILALTSALTALMTSPSIMNALGVVQGAIPWGEWTKNDDIPTLAHAKRFFSKHRAVALLTALSSVVFDRTITDIAMGYCEEAWEI